MVQGAKLINEDVFQISNEKYAVGDAVYFDPGVLQEDEKAAVDEHIPATLLPARENTRCLAFIKDSPSLKPSFAVVTRVRYER